MAEDYRALDTFPIIKTFTCLHTACTEILLPSDCNQVTIACDGTALKFGQNGKTDGVSIGTSDIMFVDSKEKFKVKIGKGRNRADSIFVQSAGAGSAVVVVMLEEVL